MPQSEACPPLLLPVLIRGFPALTPVVGLVDEPGGCWPRYLEIQRQSAVRKLRLGSASTALLRLPDLARVLAPAVIWIRLPAAMSRCRSGNPNTRCGRWAETAVAALGLIERSLFGDDQAWSRREGVGRGSPDRSAGKLAPAGIPVTRSAPATPVLS